MFPNLNTAPFPMVVYTGTSPLPDDLCEAYRMQAIFSRGLGKLIRDSDAFDISERAWAKWAYDGLTTAWQPDALAEVPLNQIQLFLKEMHWQIDTAWLEAFENGRERNFEVFIEHLFGNIRFCSHSARIHYLHVQQRNAHAS